MECLVSECAFCTVVVTSSPVPSDCSSDSFHSTTDEVPSPLPLPSSHQLYHTGLQHAMQGQVLARTLRYYFSYQLLTANKTVAAQDQGAGLLWRH